MYKLRSRGFTLIELLVVIAIIGILSAIVLASLGNARSKGNDAKVKSQLASIRSAAELYYSTNSSYGPAESNSCAGMFTDSASGLANLTNTANYPAGTVLVCNSSGAAWAVGANLSTAGQYWCADSTGKSTQEAAQLAAGTNSCN